MSDPKIVVERKGTKRNKLLITKDRIVLKLRDGVDEDGERWLLEFASRIVKAVPPGQKHSLRGSFHDDMKDGKRFFSIHLEHTGNRPVPGLMYTWNSLSMEEPKGKL